MSTYGPGPTSVKPGGVPMVWVHCTGWNCAPHYMLLEVPVVSQGKFCPQQDLHHDRHLFTGRCSEHSRSAWATRHDAINQGLEANCCSLLLHVLRIHIAGKC
jgi:hypothetical protein